MRFQSGITFGQLAQRDVFRDAGARDADCAILSPRCLECERGVLAAMVEAEAVAPVDRYALARGRAAVAAVIGPCHVDAGLVQRCERRPAGLLLPRPIAPANTFADRAAGAGNLKATMSVGHWKAEAAALRVGLAHIDLPAGFVLDEKIMQE